MSEAETVIVSETEQAREAFQSGAKPFFETVHSLEEDVSLKLQKSKNLKKQKFKKVQTAVDEFKTTETAMEDGVEVLEDLEVEGKDLLGETVQVVQSKVEELVQEEGEVKEEV